MEEDEVERFLSLRQRGECIMMAVQGYYDGAAIKPLEKITAKPNQRVIITIMDEYVEPAKQVQSRRMRGALSQYADPTLTEKERGAWERATVENMVLFDANMNCGIC